MKSTITVVSVVFLILAGCGGSQQMAVPTERLELINMTPLPPVSSIAYATGMKKLNLLIHVLQDGTVESLRMLGSSGDGEWDSLALQAMKQWRYAPPRRDGVPIDLWFRELVVVQIQEPIVMTIGELASASVERADSLYALLGKGTDLDSLFKQAIGTFDIMKYPPAVREKLRRLSQGECTGPFRVGDRYVIYKRFRKSAL
jgi:TonB family protein